MIQKIINTPSTVNQSTLDSGFIDKFHIYELIYESDYIQTKIDEKEIFKIDTKCG